MFDIYHIKKNNLEMNICHEELEAGQLSRSIPDYYYFFRKVST